MNDPVRQLVSRLDRERQPIVTAAEFKRWPAGQAALAANSGFLQEVEPAASLVYDDCEEGCVITPALIENPDIRQVAAVHYCKRDGCGRIVLDVDELRQWQPSFEWVALILTTELDLGGSASPVVPERMYLLGVIPTGSGPLDVFLGRGLTWDDAPIVIERADRLRASTGPVMIALRDLPPSELWQGQRPTVLALWDYVSCDGAESRIYFGSLSTVVRSSRPPVPPEQWLTVRECANLLLKDVSGLDVKKAMARVSWAAGKNKFRTNGKKGNARRVDRDSFSTWRLEQRERDLDADNEAY